MRPNALMLLAFYCAMLVSSMARASSGNRMVILPGDLELVGTLASQRLLIELVDDEDRFIGQAAKGIALASSDSAVATVEEGVVMPKGNGVATITATDGTHSTAIRVTVSAFDVTAQWNFRNQVQSMFTKAGCNSGACHGALAGKGGLKLSLRGYDTMRDWFTLTRQAKGRRIELADPGRSLILTKPSGAIPHKGGVRFEVGSRDYEVLASWIAEGALPPREDDARIERLELLPNEVTLSKGGKQQFLVRAHFSDGRSEDVTHWAKFAATNASVAQIDDDGAASVVGHGEGAVTAWYLSKLVIATVKSPYPQEIAAEAFAAQPPRNFIDEMIVAKLGSLNLPPSSRASDQEFVRRVYLDTIGTLPTIDEVRQFVADTSPDKRDRLIETLLDRPEFVDYWAYKWSDLFLVNGRRLRPQAVQAYYQWIHQGVAENKPWDRFARDIVTAIGDSFENGATNFYALHQDPLEMTENLCVAFLGLNINCARCHNHPLEKWTNDQYYAMANQFSRVRAKGWGGELTNGDGKRTVYVAPQGDLIQPSSGKPQPPTPLDGKSMSLDDPSDRRVPFADWLTSPDNPYFAKAIANRVWANYFGVGLVEPIDDLRISNPASNDALLAAAANYLVENHYDLKALMRAILQSNAYQRTSLPLAENKDDTRYYSRYYPRRLMAEVLLDAVSQVTGVATPFTETTEITNKTQPTKDYPLGTRAMALRDSSVVSQFLKTFGRNERMITCECERSSEPTMVQVLHIANGSTINDKLAAADNKIDQWIAAKLSDREIIENLYLAAMARPPTEDEVSEIQKALEASADTPRRELLEDVFWSVLSSREFVFNH